MTRPAHEQLLLEISEETWNLWRHNPITAAYLLFLEDQAQSFRTAAMDLLEAGTLVPQADMIRGRLANLRELQTLSLGAIQNFYRPDNQADEEVNGRQVDQGPSR